MKMKAAIYIFLVLQVGCRSDTVSDKGISVGNPAETALRLAPGEGLTYSDARLALSEITWNGCVGTADLTVGLPAGDQIDLIDADPIPVPEGEWCGLSLTPDGPLSIAVMDAGVATEITLILHALNFSTVGDEILSAQHTVIELGGAGWLSPVDLGMTDGEAVDIDITHENHDVLVERIDRLSAIYIDTNENGVLDEDEGDSLPIASPDEDEDSGDDEEDSGDDDEDGVDDDEDGGDDEEDGVDGEEDGGDGEEDGGDGEEGSGEPEEDEDDGSEA
jgi:hypothetical protein